MNHNPELIQGLSEVRWPEIAGELMQSLQVINCRRTSLPELAELKAPLRELLEECLCSTRRTKRVEARRVIDNEWTDDRAAAWDAVRLRVGEAVPLNHQKPAFSVMMSTRIALASRTVPLPIVHIHGDENCWGDLLSRWVTCPGGSICVHASVMYAEVLFAGSHNFPTRRAGGCCGDGPALDTALGGGFAGFRKAVPNGVPRTPCDLGAGRGRVSEKATAGVCPPGGGRTPFGRRCNDGSA